MRQFSRSRLKSEGQSQLSQSLKNVSPRGAAVMMLGLILVSAQLFIVSSRQAAADCLRDRIANAGTPEVVSERGSMDPKRVGDFLVVAVVQIESDGIARKVGKAGERGLMQIKRSTWKQVTQKLFGRSLPFDRAFEPALNRRVGRAYLAEMQEFLHANRRRWHANADERSLLLACYNAGPGCVKAAGFNLKRLPASTRSYIERATALHDYYLAGDAARVRELLLVQNRVLLDSAGS